MYQFCFVAVYNMEPVYFCIIYLQYMDPKDASTAIENLRGRTLFEHSKPVVIKVSQSCAVTISNISYRVVVCR